MAKVSEEIPDQIKIVGKGDKLFPYAKVKETVVSIGGLFYLRHDEDNITWVENEKGQLRAYRKSSPLIIPDNVNGGYMLKSMAYQTEDGIWLNRKSGDVVKIGDKYHRKSYCTQIEGQWILLSDERIATCPYNGEVFFKAKGITLSSKYYKKNPLVGPNTRTTVDSDGDIIRVEDIYTYYDLVSSEIKKVHVRNPIVKGGEGMSNILVDFQDKTNPQEDRLVMLPAPRLQMILTHGPGDNIEEFALIPGGRAYIIPTALKSYFLDKRDNFILPRYETKLQVIKDKLNKNFSDLDPTENVARVFAHVGKPFPGKHNIYTPNNYPEKVLSKSFKRTGGIEFSFGIEFETSDGLIANTTLEKLGIMAVGDRSVGSAEYVTPPLQGDAGIEKLEEICKYLNSETLVDDRCGLHVHVGTLFPKKSESKPEAWQAPSFSKPFLLNAIKLGALIEEELYASLPKSRYPTLYHCHSIKRFGDISKENFDTYLGAYIFGPKEWWLPPNEQCHTTLFNFEEYKLGPNRNHTANLGTWAEGRYKWLNLIPSYTATAHRTIEFRIFPGTTTFNKTYAYLLTSLAFTYVIDNHTALIKPGVTLAQIFAAAYKGYPKLITYLNDFYDERKARFNRTNIYQEVIAKAKVELPFLKKDN